MFDKIKLADPSKTDYEKPLFSIITPTFRRPEMLTRNIKSVINQTFGNYQHLIIDDGNNAENEKVVKEFNDKRIVLLKHEIPRGAAAAYNTGIRASKGEFITFLDDDDEYLPQFLEKMYEKFSKTSEKIGFIWTGIMKVNDSGTSGNSNAVFLWPSSFPDKESSMISASSIGNGFGVCLRKKWIEKIGTYDEKLPVCSDTDFMIRLAEASSCLTIPEILVKVHVHGKTQLTDKERNSERIIATATLLDRYSEIFSSFPRLFIVHLNSYVLLCYASGQKHKGRKSVLRMIRKKPLRIRTYLDFLSLELTGRGASDTMLGKYLKNFM